LKTRDAVNINGHKISFPVPSSTEKKNWRKFENFGFLDTDQIGLFETKKRDS